MIYLLLVFLVIIIGLSDYEYKKGSMSHHHALCQASTLLPLTQTFGVCKCM